MFVKMLLLVFILLVHYVHITSSLFSSKSWDDVILPPLSNKIGDDVVLFFAQVYKIIIIAIIIVTIIL